MYRFAPLMVRASSTHNLDLPLVMGHDGYHGIRWLFCLSRETRLKLPLYVAAVYPTCRSLLAAPWPAPYDPAAAVKKRYAAVVRHPCKRRLNVEGRK
jgi:hypothetical protein